MGEILKAVTTWWRRTRLHRTHAAFALRVTDISVEDTWVGRAATATAFSVTSAFAAMFPASIAALAGARGATLAAAYVLAAGIPAIAVTWWAFTANSHTVDERLTRAVHAEASAGKLRRKLSPKVVTAAKLVDTAINELGDRRDRRRARAQKRRILAEVDHLLELAVHAGLYEWALDPAADDFGDWRISRHRREHEGYGALCELLAARRDELDDLQRALRTEATNIATNSGTATLAKQRQELISQHLCALRELERGETVPSLARYRRERAEAVSVGLAELS